MRPKLMHVSTSGRSLASLGSRLLRLSDEGFDVIGVSGPEPEASGIRALSVRSLGPGWAPEDDLRALGEMVRIFRRERPALVHAHDPRSAVLGGAAARLARVPAVVTTVRELGVPSGRGGIGRSLRRATSLSHHELFESHEDLDLAIRERLVARGRASWLGAGVDLRRFDPGAVDRETVEVLRRSWGVPEGAQVVGTVAPLLPENGYAELFHAAAELRRTRPRVVFVGVGPRGPRAAGGLSGVDLERARRAGVVLPGEAAREDMPAIYAAFDVFVNASSREGLPRAAIEASAMGLPVVATDVPGRREVVDAGITGALVPGRDPRALAAAVAELIQDPESAATAGKAARERALDRFDEGAVVERTLQVYRRLLRAHGIRWDGEARED